MLRMSGEGDESARKSILFVCLGNICRSPIAEAVCRKIIKERGQESLWKIDSAATSGWHVLDNPDARALNVLKSHGIEYEHTVRQVTEDDFQDFYWIFAMDEANMKELTALAPPGFKGFIQLLGNFDPYGDVVIRDPYYDPDDAGFVKCYDQCVRDITAFFDRIGV